MVSRTLKRSPWIFHPQVAAEVVQLLIEEALCTATDGIVSPRRLRRPLSGVHWSQAQRRSHKQGGYKGSTPSTMRRDFNFSR
jgi:hypothetical protein